MNQSRDFQAEVSTECPSQEKKVGHGKPGRSGPPGNKNALKHGLHSYKAMIDGKGLDERTTCSTAISSPKPRCANEPVNAKRSPNPTDDK